MQEICAHFHAWATFLSGTASLGLYIPEQCVLGGFFGMCFFQHFEAFGAIFQLGLWEESSLPSHTRRQRLGKGENLRKPAFAAFNTNVNGETKSARWKEERRCSQMGGYQAYQCTTPHSNMFVVEKFHASQ